MTQIAANLGMLFTDRPLFERFGAAAAVGFRAVELLFPYETPPAAVKAELERHHLTMLGLNTATGGPGDFGLGAVPGRERDFAAIFQQALDYAVAVGAPQIHCMAGIAPPDGLDAAEAVFVQNLAAAADLARPHGVTLLIEPINTRDRPGYALTHIEQAADIIERAERDNIRIQFDCYHTQIMGGDLIKRFERHLPLIGHVQIAGVPERGEPDHGEVNYPELLASFDQLGYAGFVAAEYRPAGRTEEGLAWAEQYGITI